MKLNTELINEFMSDIDEAYGFKHRLYYISPLIQNSIDHFVSKLKLKGFKQDALHEILFDQQDTVKYLGSEKAIYCIKCNHEPFLPDEQPYVMHMAFETGSTYIPIVYEFDTAITDDGRLMVEITPVDQLSDYIDSMSLDKSKQFIDSLQSDLAIFLTKELFLKYVEIDIQLVKSKTKIKKSKVNAQSVNNKTRYDIVSITSSWYTTITQIKGSFVNGFWRTQPYGPGRSKTKIIWINPFKRGPYTRRARKLEDPVYQ